MRKTSQLYKGIPETPGVYLMNNVRGSLLYVGKAVNLRRRVSSYFQKAHDYRIERLVGEIGSIDYQQTDTAIEALILEAKLIKKHQPPYNILGKDGKSFLTVLITRESFPRVLLIREGDNRLGTRFGPFTSARSIREALRLIRRIFPFHDHPVESLPPGRDHGAGDLKSKKRYRPCFNYQIGLCPGVCGGMISQREYRNTIRNIRLFFQGKKERIITALKKEMAMASKAERYEEAHALKKKLFALQHIQDVSLVGDNAITLPYRRREGIYAHSFTERIEGYDISNISGHSAVGSMVVFIDDKPDKSQYRRFRIKTVTGSNDVAMLAEVLERRFGNDWPKPNLILIDGGKPQVNAAKHVLKTHGLHIPVIGIAKGPKRTKNEFTGILPSQLDEHILIRVRDEAHRFAVAYHKHLRSKQFYQ